jgi:D-threo-aldose 1-dehydrogenase
MTAASLIRRRLGRTGLEVTPLCIGTSPLASMANLYGYGVDHERAVATISAAFRSPINFIDTSNGYGEDGTAERRIGDAIRRAGGLPADVVLATKVDPDPKTGVFSGDRVRASFEESMNRLGLDRVPLLHLHDPERISLAEGLGPGGPVEALVDLRNRGLVDHLGVAGGPVDILAAYLDTGEFEVLLSHNRYTLLDRSAEALFESAMARGIAVLNAAPYGGGMLSKGPEVQQHYAYGTGDDTLRHAASAMEAVCRRYDVPLAAAALQFSVRSELITSTIVGVSAPERIEQTLRLVATPVPDDLWPDLERFVPAREHWLD